MKCCIVAVACPGFSPRRREEYMLALTRSEGEGFTFEVPGGHSFEIVLEEVSLQGGCKFRLNPSRTDVGMRFDDRSWKFKFHGFRFEMTAREFEAHRCRFAFKAPDAVTIKRSELLKK